MTTTTTCQICGRAILAKTGLIAHHGYRRPHHMGFQTASCEGAKCKPYEVSCGAIDAAIARRHAYIDRCHENICDALSNPPGELHKRDVYGRIARTFALPQDFDAEDVANRPTHTIRFCSYSLLFHNMISELRRQIRGTTDDIKFLAARKAAWVAPITETAGAR